MARKPLTSSNSLSANYSQTNSMMRELYTQRILQRFSLRSATTSLSNGEIVNINVNAESSRKRLIHAGADYAIFVGSVAPENILVPYTDESTQDLSDWQIIGPLNNLFVNGDQSEEVEPYESTLTLTIRNISAGTVDLLVYLKPRVVTSFAGSGSE